MNLFVETPGNGACLDPAGEVGEQGAERGRGRPLWTHSATVAAVERLLANPDVDVNDENRNGKRAIHFAAQLRSDTEVLTMLINASADVNAATHRGHTPLIYAAGRSRANVVELLRIMGQMRRRGL